MTPLRFACTLLVVVFTISASGLTQAVPPSQAQTKDDPDARPPVTATDLKIVHRAQELLSSSAKWNRADNRQCPKTENTFSLYCALEQATIDAGQDFQHRGAALQEMRFVIDEI